MVYLSEKMRVIFDSLRGYYFRHGQKNHVTLLFYKLKLHMKFLTHFGLKYVPFQEGDIVLCDHHSFSNLKSKFNRLLELPGIGVVIGESDLNVIVALRNITSEVKTAKYNLHYITETGFSRNQFYQILANKLGVELAARRFDLWCNIKERLVNLKMQCKTLPVIVIDKAQNLPHDLLIDLPSFLNFNYDSEDMLTLWLAGNNHLRYKIKKSQYETLNSRIRIWHDLKSTQSLETFKNFIEHGFNQAGCTTKLLSDDGLRILKNTTECSPQKIYNAISNCLQIAYEKDLTHIPDALLNQVLCDNRI